MKKRNKYCCKDLEAADNKFGGIIFAYVGNGQELFRTTMRDLISINFCPWCGKKQLSKNPRVLELKD